MGFLEERDLTNVPSIPEYYKGKTIFITGGSGFMGKVLIEKLLYSCGDLDRIYLLLRSKKGVKSDDRLADIYSSQCFDRLRNEKPDVYQQKVFVVAGDVMENGLGLSEEDKALLINRVNIIFHVAASVRFDDPLHFAAKLNLNGTKLVMDLAKEIRNLSAVVHVSTSYSNTNWNPVDEVMYPPHADWRDILDICDNIDEHSLKVLTPKILGELPNTYTFTKQLAEHVVYELKGQLPVVIIRPSIVVSSVDEPMPGWIENFNGPVGLLVASGKGIMRSLYTDPDLVSDYIPVDISIKSFIAAAWIRGTKKLDSTDDVPIYNCCASKLNSMTMGEMIETGRQLAYVIPPNGVLWNIGGQLTTSATLHYIKVILFHLLPALLVDSVLCVIGQKPLLVKIQRRIYIANLALKYYVTQQWTFENTNFIDLRSSIKENDKKTFYYEIENINPVKYFTDSCIGGKVYLLKEKMEDLPKAKAHLNRMVIVDMIVKCLFYGYIIFWMYNNIVSSVLEYIYDNYIL